MAKKIKAYSAKTESINLVNEPMLGYIVSPLAGLKSKAASVIITKEFTYKSFKKVMDKTTFTLADWALILYTSERTLLRYAKTNAAFNGLQTERILLLEKMIDAGNDLFGANLASWLKKPSIKYNGATPFSQLLSYSGIQNVINYLGQLEWGVLA